MSLEGNLYCTHLRCGSVMCINELGSQCPRIIKIFGLQRENMIYKRKAERWLFPLKFEEGMQVFSL